MKPNDAHLDELRILKSIAERLNGLVEIHGALGEVLGLLVHLLGLKTAWLFLQEGDELAPAGVYGLPPALAENDCRPLRGGWCSCQDLYRNNRLAEAVNIVQCSRLRNAKGDRGGLVYHASVPLISQDKRIGILNVAAAGRELFTDETLAILSAVGLQIGTAIARSFLSERQREVALMEARHRLAADLHDSVSQSLFSLVMTVRAAREQFSRSQTEAAKAALAQADTLARSALGEMRALVFGLRQAELAEKGFGETLRRYVKAQPLLANVEVDMTVDGEPAGTIAETAFRIVQEGLNNIIKHAGARRVAVRVVTGTDRVEIEVSDDGKGFDPASTPEGFGRRFLQERCAVLGGELRVESTPGEGAQLKAFLPIERGES